MRLLKVADNADAMLDFALSVWYNKTNAILAECALLLLICRSNMLGTATERAFRRLGNLT
ncbi:MAG: hypothetical protein NC132_05390 [Corallococcus sp.]|nr:hypothetical protein [Corallococcus sp.]